MQGVGKVVGTLGSSNVNKTLNFTVIKPENAVVNNNLKKPPINAASK